ncbi:hypothetical protein [Rarobacter faecitabidus]|nr:hypothetical protein [Rarobacter faecitabidus]
MRHADRLSVRGQIIGVVDLVGTHHWSDCLDGAFGCSPWALSDCWHIALANPRPIDPIPYKGALGLTTIADPVVLGRLRATL